MCMKVFIKVLTLLDKVLFYISAVLNNWSICIGNKVELMVAKLNGKPVFYSSAYNMSYTEISEHIRNGESYEILKGYQLGSEAVGNSVMVYSEKHNKVILIDKRFLADTPDKATIIIGDIISHNPTELLHIEMGSSKEFFDEEDTVENIIESPLDEKLNKVVRDFKKENNKNYKSYVKKFKSQASGSKNKKKPTKKVLKSKNTKNKKETK